jgi:hypothetical protein
MTVAFVHFRNLEFFDDLEPAVNREGPTTDGDACDR